MRYALLTIALLSIASICLAAETEMDETVEVVLKSGRVIQGYVLQETTSTITVQTSLNQMEISKLNIESINGNSPYVGRSPADASIEAPLPKEVLIPAGPFLMGDSQGDENNLIHRVYLDEYWIDTFEVTNSQYREFLSATGRSEPKYFSDSNYNQDNQPVVGVSWSDASSYCSWGKKRLPTEAEWEKAARGENSQVFPWGDTFLASRANTKESKNRQPVGVGNYTHGVSPFNLHDLAGNVWEWCDDWYNKEYYENSPSRNPGGPATGKDRVVRGGGWNTLHVNMAFRRGIKPNKSFESLGFRCARTP